MISLFHLKLQRMPISVNKFSWKAWWTWGVESLTTAVGFLWQFACEPGHGQGCLRVDDHERWEHSRHRGPDQHHPGGTGAPGVPADRQDRCYSAHVHLEASGRGWGDPNLSVPTRVYGCVFAHVWECWVHRVPQTDCESGLEPISLFWHNRIIRISEMWNS